MNDEHLSLSEANSSFSVKNATKVVFVLFLIILLFVFLVSSISGFLMKTPSPFLVGALEASVYGIIVMVVYFYARQGSPYPWQALGIRKTNPGKTLFFIIAGIISILVTSFLYSAFLNYFHIPNPDQSKAITRMFGSSLIGLIVTFIVVVIIAPFAEELLFRGFLYPSFKNNWGVAWAIVVTSFLFALAHVSALILLPVYFFIGAVLAFLREKNNSVIPSMLLHALNNLIFFLVLVNLLK
jgi:membrane protease YdiL (CAAX protease family)